MAARSFAGHRPSRRRGFNSARTHHAAGGWPDGRRGERHGNREHGGDDGGEELHRAGVRLVVQGVEARRRLRSDERLTKLPSRFDCEIAILLVEGMRVQQNQTGCRGLDFDVPPAAFERGGLSPNGGAPASSPTWAELPRTPASRRRVGRRELRHRVASRVWSRRRSIGRVVIRFIKQGSRVRSIFARRPSAPPAG